MMGGWADERLSPLLATSSRQGAHLRMAGL